MAKENAPLSRKEEEEKKAAEAQQQSGYMPGKGTATYNRMMNKLSPLKGGGMFKKKSNVSQPGDASELQADAVAKAVTEGNANAAQVELQNDVTSAEGITAKASDVTIETPPGFEEQIEKMKGGGLPLPDDKKANLEEMLGTELDHVRLHMGSDAATLAGDINALAFATGNDIFYPGDLNDEELLAHEVTHTLQGEEEFKLIRRKYEKGANLQSSWFAGIEELEKAFDGSPVISMGGWYRFAVERIQFALYEIFRLNAGRNGFIDPGPIDGRFETKTKDALIAFQKEFNLTQSGKIGPQTMAKLDELFYQEAALPAGSMVDTERDVLPVSDDRFYKFGVHAPRGLAVSFTVFEPIETDDPSRIALKQLISLSYKTIKPEQVEEIKYQLVWTSFSARSAGATVKTVFPVNLWLIGLKTIYKEKPFIVEFINQYWDQVELNASTLIPKFNSIVDALAQLDDSEYSVMVRYGLIPAHIDNLASYDENLIPRFKAYAWLFLRTEILKEPGTDRDKRFQQLVDDIDNLGITTTEYKAIVENNQAIPQEIKDKGVTSSQVLEDYKNNFITQAKNILIGRTLNLLDENEREVKKEVDRYTNNPKDMDDLVDLLLTGKISNEFAVHEATLCREIWRYCSDFGLEVFYINEVGNYPMEKAYFTTEFKTALQGGQAGIAKYVLTSSLEDVAWTIQSLGYVFSSEFNAGKKKHDKFLKGMELNKSKDPGLYDEVMGSIIHNPPGLFQEQFYLPRDTSMKIITTYYPELFTALKGMVDVVQVDNEAAREKYPILKDQSIKFRDISRKYYYKNGIGGIPDKAGLKTALFEEMNTKLDNVKEVRRKVRSEGEDDYVWTFEGIVNSFKNEFGISDDSIMSSWLKEGSDAVADRLFWWGIVLGAIGLIVGIAGAITLNPYVIGLGVLISTIDFAVQYDYYTFQNAATNTGFGQQLTVVEAPLWPVILALAGIVFEVAGAIGGIIKIFTNVKRGIPALKTSLRRVWAEMSQELEKKGYKSYDEFEKEMLRIYNEGFEKEIRTPLFQKMLGDFPVMSQFDQRIQVALHKIYQKDESLLAILMKNADSGKNSVINLAAEAFVNPDIIQVYQKAAKQFGTYTDDAAEFFRFIGDKGYKFIGQLDQAIEYLPRAVDGNALPPPALLRILKNPKYYEKVVDNVAQLADVNFIKKAKELLEEALPQSSKPLANDDNVIRSVQRILQQGVSETDLKAIIRNSDGSFPDDPRMFNISNLLHGLDVALSIKPSYMDLLLTYLKQGTKGPKGDFSKAMRTLVYAFYKNKWDMLDLIYKSKVLGNIFIPPQGFSLTSWQKLTQSILNNTTKYQGFGLKIKAQGSRLMGAADETSRFGRTVSDIDFVFEGNPADFKKVLGMIFGDEKGLYQLIYGKAPKIDWYNFPTLLDDFIEKVKLDYLAPVNTRKLTGGNRQIARDMIDGNEKGFIYGHRLSTDGGEQLDIFLNQPAVKTHDFPVEVGFKRTAPEGFIDPPFIELN